MNSPDSVRLNLFESCLHRSQSAHPSLSAAFCLLSSSTSSSDNLFLFILFFLIPDIPQLALRDDLFERVEALLADGAVTSSLYPPEEGATVYDMGFCIAVSHTGVGGEV